MSFKSVFGIVLSLALVAVLVCIFDWSKVLGALKQMRLWPLIPATLLFLLQNIFRAWRWRLLLPEGVKYRTRDLFDALMVGNLANFVLPLRAGEFIRPFLLTKYSGTSYPISFVSVIVERFFDLALVLGLFGVVLLFIPGIPAEAHLGATALSSLALVILVIMVLGSFMEAKLLAAFDFISHPLPLKIRSPLRKFCKDFLDGAAVLRTPARVIQIIFMTVIIWALIIALSWVFFELFEITPSIEAALAVTVITALAVAAPSAPGAIGVYHLACVAAITLFAYPQEKAVAYSIISHFYNLVMFVILGGYVLWRDGLKLADLKPASGKNLAPTP